jgi:hypothetical protein
MSRFTYVPDVGSLDAGFPAGLRPPALLREFASWVAGQPRSSLGWFHLESEPLDATFVHDDHAADLVREQLGVFMLLPDGSRIALWSQPERDPAVVLIAPNGAHRGIAPDLEAFLLALAHERTGVAGLDRSQDDTARARAELVAWLADRGIETRAPSDAADSFGSWFEATVARARAEPDPYARPRRSSLHAGPLPADLIAAVDPLLGCAIDEPAVIGFFEQLGSDLATIRDPDAFRVIARPEDGVFFEVAWPWSYPSQWATAEYPTPARRALEQQRRRMFWGVTLLVAPERRAVRDAREELSFAAYAGALPRGISAGDQAHDLEARLGPPTDGNLAAYTWDDPKRRRTLITRWNDGRTIRPELPRGALCSITWRFSLSHET